MSKSHPKYKYLEKAPGTPKPKPEDKKLSADEDFPEIPAAHFSDKNSSASSLRIARARSVSFDEKEWEEVDGSIHPPSPVTPKNATSSELAHSDISVRFTGEGSDI